MIMKKLKTILVAIVVSVTMLSCTSLYDHFTYTETIQTKLEALSLMDKSTRPFIDSEDQVTNLKNEMERMVIYERGKQKNQITQKMWELISSDEHLMGSYLKLWEEKGQLNEAFKDEAKPQIEKAFDLMIHYEEQKDKKSENALTQFINQFIQ